MKKEFLLFKELSNKQLYDVLKLRQDVFIIEQDCIYNDFDGYDNEATHFIIYDGDILAAYSRIFNPGVKYNHEASIGRIIVRDSYRGGKIGKELISDSISFCFKHNPESSIKIEAQAALENYYSRFGFAGVSDIYPVDGIDHLEMVLKPKN